MIVSVNNCQDDHKRPHNTEVSPMRLNTWYCMVTPFKAKAENSSPLLHISLIDISKIRYHSKNFLFDYEQQNYYSSSILKYLLGALFP